MQRVTIENYVEINGKVYLMDDLPPDELRRVSELIQERMMGTLGFTRTRKEKSA